MGWRFFCEGYLGVGRYFFCFMFFGGLLYPLYMLGAIGAGDVKLMAMSAGYFSYRDAVNYFLCMLFLSAILGLLKMLSEQNFKERVVYFLSYICEVIRTGKWHLYFSNCKEERNSSNQMRMSIPMLIGFVFYIGGLY